MKQIKSFLLFKERATIINLTSVLFMRLRDVGDLANHMTKDNGNDLRWAGQG